MKSPRMLVNFGFASISNPNHTGELGQMLMNLDCVEQWLKILNPLKCVDWIDSVRKLKRKEKCFIQIIDSEIAKVIKIQRN